jgi:hypothetical protein
MKKTLLILPVMLLFILGCNFIDKLTHFNMEYNQTVTIPAAIDINLPVNTEIPDVETNSEATFSVNNTHKDLIEEVLLSKLELAITAPTDGDFTFLKSIAIYMSADSLDEIKIAWQDSIPSNCGDSLILETTNADLKDYIMKDSFDYRVNTVVQKIITSDYTINMHSVFYVDAKILGQ